MKAWLVGLLAGTMLVMLGMSGGGTTVHAEGTETTKVTIHYQPLEGDTKEWSLWVWGEGGEGARFPFTGVDENGAKVAEIELQGKYDKVGFIVSTEDWLKDGSDQFIEIVNGTGEAHVIGGGGKAAEGAGNIPMLWLIVGPVLAIIYFTVMEQLRRRRVAVA